MNMDASDAALIAEPHAPGATRNMNSIRYTTDGGTFLCNTTIPIPPWGTSEPRYDSEDEDEDEKNHSSGVCICMNCLRRVLASRNLAGDLGDQMFGHLVSTELARDILTSFVSEGFVQVLEVHGEPASQAPVAPLSDDAQNAVRQAFEAAVAYGCVHPGANPPKEHSPPAEQQDMKKEKTYLFKWSTFPQEPLRRDELVSFLNDVSDRAFAIMKSRLPSTNLELRHRFATSEQVLLLAYGLDSQDIQPNFFLLPIKAFSDEGLKTVDAKYLNFSAFRLVGGSHERIPRLGLVDMENFAEFLKCAQPWVYYVLGMTFLRNLVVLSRGDCSDWEHLPLVPWDGRGSIELIRVLLGLVLADGMDLGQNPFIELMSEVHSYQLDTSTGSSPTGAGSSAGSYMDADDREDDAATCWHSAHSTIPDEKSAEKRHYSGVEKGDEDEEHLEMKKRKIVDSSANPLDGF